MRPAKSSSLGVCASVFAGLHPTHHQLASGGVRIAERELGLLVSGDRRHERQGRQAPPRDLQLGLEDAGHESAARCLSDELGAWVVQLRNRSDTANGRDQRTSSSDRLARSASDDPRLREVRESMARTTARPVQPMRLASARSHAHRLRSAVGQAGEPGDDAQSRRLDFLDVSRSLVPTSSSVHLRS